MHHFGATASTVLNQGSMIESPVKSLDLTLTQLRTASFKDGMGYIGVEKKIPSEKKEK